MIYEPRSCLFCRNRHFTLQADDEELHPDIGVKVASNADPENKTGILKYKDPNPGSLINYNPIADNSLYADSTIGTDLDKFFSRPVLIQSLNWVLGTPFTNTEIRPWQLYFNDTRVKKKLDNYAYISCNLHVKIMINASPFLYGLMLATYRPMADAQPTTVFQVPGKTGYLTNVSQRPHIWIYPSNSQGGEFILPYFNYKAWINATSNSEMLNMGALAFYEYIGLSAASALASATINVQVYAWATDVRLSGSTLKLALQSEDEYKNPDGPISKPASIISRAAGVLSEIPLISKYAMATQQVTKRISQIAHYFGFSNTPIVESVKPYKPFSFHSFASPEISQPIDRLTLDPKNELTVDPRTVGLPPSDELSILPFVQRESYLTMSPWLTTDPTTTILFSSLVLPDLFNLDVNTTPSYSVKQCTPLSYAQELFQYWRGDIIFRFRFINTRFHRGRVRITWDPIGDTLDTDPLSSTVAYNRIVDISEETDIEVTIPFVQDVSFCRTTQGATTLNYANGALSSVHSSLDNGKINVTVFNELSAPTASANAWLVVSVRAGNTFNFSAPRDLGTNLSTYQLQSEDDESHEVAKEVEYDSPTRELIAFKDTTVDPNLFKVHMGEVVNSFRTLLHRTSLAFTSSNSSSGVANSIQNMGFVHSIYPPIYGFDPNGIHSANNTLGVGTSAFNFVPNSAFNWITQCFVGMRGSMYWHYNNRSPSASTQIIASRSIKTLTAAGYMTNTAYVLTASLSNVNNINLGLPNGLGGLTLTNVHTQAGVSVNVPLYCYYRFVCTTNTTRTLDNGTLVNTNKNNVQAYMATFPAANGASTLYSNKLDAYYTAGPDFTCFYYLNVPSLFVYPTITPV